MEIQQHVVYRLNGKGFRTLSACRQHVEDQLGAVIDRFDVTLTPAQRLNILRELTDNKESRDLLCSYLNVHVTEGDTHLNILECKQ